MNTTPTPRPAPPSRPLCCRALAALLSLAVAGGCAAPAPAPPRTPPQPRPAELAEPGRFTLLAINDVYRIQGLGPVTDGTGTHGGLARLRTLRRELETERGPVLLLHGGDFLSPSLLSRRYRGAQMIDVLNLLDGDPQAFDRSMFVTFGNHEFDAAKLEDAVALDAHVEASQFHWLGSNLWFDTDAAGQPLVAAPNLSGTAMVTVGGVRVGLFSLTIESSRPAYLLGFHDREDTAYDATDKLRTAGAEVVIALTHLEVGEDVALLEALGDRGPDLVIGGHEHQALTRRVGERWVLKSDADATTARIVEITPRPGEPPRIEHRLVELGPDGPAPDPQVAATVADWLERFDREQCAAEGEEPGCLDRAVGKTRVELDGEETEIRRFETNLGDWIADRLRQHWSAAVTAADPGAPLVAAVNSGSLRLNRDLPPGWITRRDIGELFAYPAPPVLLRIDGLTLRRIVARSIEDWEGSGHWLQVSGLAFAHDPDRGTAERLTLLTAGGPRPLEDHDRVYLATVGYLVDPTIGDQDGYSMIGPSDVVSRSESDLRDLVLEDLRQAWEEGIAPEKVGRICNPQRPGPCLAAPAGPSGVTP